MLLVPACPLQRQFFLSVKHAHRRDTRNQAHLLRRWGCRQAVRQLHRYMRVVAGAADAAALRGLEGAAAREFFAGLGVVLARTSFTFTGRQRRPPPDPVNALLSLGYTLLLGEVRQVLHGFGLDPFAGFFHASNGGQPACALDVMEPLRCLVDRLVVKVIRRGMLQPEDFRFEDGCCLLADGRRGVFYRAWEGRLAEELIWRGERHSLRRLIHAQVEGLARHLDDPECRFQPFLLSEIGR